MEIQLNHKDRFRIYSDHDKNNFIDINQAGYKGIAIDMYPHFHYIEIRKKKDLIRMFLFEKKSHKKEYDFGYYSDAEVVFALNEVNK